MYVLILWLDISKSMCLYQRKENISYKRSGTILLCFCSFHHWKYQIPLTLSCSPHSLSVDSYVSLSSRRWLWILDPPASNSLCYDYKHIPPWIVYVAQGFMHATQARYQLRCIVCPLNPISEQVNKNPIYPFLKHCWWR